jgi:hypothetical protein
MRRASINLGTYNAARDGSAIAARANTRAETFS